MSDDTDADENDADEEIDYMSGFGALADTNAPEYVREEHEALNENLKERERRWAQRRSNEGGDEP